MKLETRKLLDKHFDTAFSAPDGIKKLRELILTLAMQGKLVAQDPNDQPASELLKEIEAEKKRLVKEGKIKPPKPLPEIKPEEVPYEVPKGWEWVRLGEISKINGGFAFKSQLYTNHGIRVIRISDFNEGGFLNDKIVRYRFDEKLSDFLLEDRNILMAMTGGTVGKCFLVDKLPEPMVVNQRVATIKLLNKVEDKFIYSLIQTNLIQNVIQNAKNSTNDNISMNDIYCFYIPLPPLAEQKRIVAKIDQLMARCDELEQLRASHAQKRIAVQAAAVRQLLDSENPEQCIDAWQFLAQNFGELHADKTNVAELRKAILQLAVMGKLVPQDPHDQPASELLKEIEAEKKRLVKEGKIKPPKPLPEIKPDEVPYEVPEGWELARLGEIGLINPRNENIDNSQDSGFVPMKLIAEGFSNYHDFEVKKWLDIKNGYTHLKNNDIAVAKITPCFENAKSCVLKNLPNEIGAGTTELHVFRNIFNAVNLHYLLSFFKNPFFLDKTEQKMTGTAGQKRVPTAVFCELLIPLPPLAEQKRIVTKIDQLMSRCDALEALIDQTTNKQAQLLNALMAEV